MPEANRKFMTSTAELLLTERNEEREARLLAEARATAAERKYEDLVIRVESLLETIRRMEASTTRIKEILAGLHKEDPDTPAGS